MDEIAKRKTIAANITRCRKLAGKNQQDIADRLNIPRTGVSRMETGDRGVDVLELVALADYLNTTIDCLLWGAEELGAIEPVRAVPSVTENEFNRYPFTC